MQNLENQIVSLLSGGEFTMRELCKKTGAQAGDIRRVLTGMTYRYPLYEDSEPRPGKTGGVVINCKYGILPE